eukprot:6183109-Pleurochrysis_carterae.AAC.2
MRDYDACFAGWRLVYLHASRLLTRRFRQPEQRCDRLHERWHRVRGARARAYVRAACGAPSGSASRFDVDLLCADRLRFVRAVLIQFDCQPLWRRGGQVAGVSATAFCGEGASVA